MNLKFAAAAVLAFLSLGAGARTLDQVLHDNGVEMNHAKEWTAAEPKVRKGHVMTFSHFSTETRNGETLRFSIVTPISKTDAQAMASLKHTVLRGLYRNHPTPYSGEFTNTTVCPRRFRPRQLANPNPAALGKILVARVNSRRTWGDCTPGSNASWGADGFLYDPPRERLVHVTLYLNSMAKGDGFITRTFRSIRFPADQTKK